jgi:K(+)-stimulated pyrophosphate-energized sodium pump
MIIGLTFGAAILALIFSGYLIFNIRSQPSGSEKMKEISAAVKTGATAYLYRQYKTLLPIVIVVALILGFTLKFYTAIAFVFGAILSALAGYIGMQISVRTNVKVAEKAKLGLAEGLRLSFKGGAVTGFAVAALGLLGVATLYYFYQDPRLIIGFGFGASLISLFMRVGGGIYTKAADVGADLVGKVEKGIPEDDPRNPAVIADQVGDNVGDCAGMAADVFESYVVTLIAAMLLGLTLGQNGVLFPLAIGASAIVASLIGTFFVRLGRDKNIWKALNRGILFTAIISAVFFYFISDYFFHDLKIFFAALIGLAVAVLVGTITEYYTSKERRPVREVAESARTGAGTNIITGMAVGLQSTIWPVLIISVAMLLAYYLVGIYGIAIAALGMLSVTGMILAIDAYGPITDNAGGIAEMAGLPSRTRKVTDALDSVGNTTKAVTKGFAIGSAALAALSLFVAFAQAANLQIINVLDPRVVVGLFIGAALPFLFSSFLMKAVGRAAFQIVEEVRHQFRTIKGLMQGRAKPDYKRCVDITTRAALREFIIPGILAILAPIIVGFALGPLALAGLLAGSIVTGLLMGLFLANSGAAWDNAKKYIEDGNFGGKGSDAHKAAVIGDTVGDPAKDTAGPSLNPLIKVLNMIALLFAGLFIYSLL